MAKNNFITTTDKETADQLLKLGFQLLSSENGRYTFLNCLKYSTEQIDKNKIVYTNILCI